MHHKQYWSRYSRVHHCLRSHYAKWCVLIAAFACVALSVSLSGIHKLGEGAEEIPGSSSEL